jgi:hypothetical protein
MEQRVFMDSLDTARFACPECRREKIMQLSAYDIKKHTTRVRVKCKCGHSHIITLEKMVEAQKSMQLLGTFIAKDRDRLFGKMIIKKLNSKGIMLKTNIEQSLLPGLRLVLEFVLDDAKQSIVKKEVVVKAKKGKFLTAEFTSHLHDDNLGPYLFNNRLYI